MLHNERAPKNFFMAKYKTAPKKTELNYKKTKEFETKQDEKDQKAL